MLYKKVEKYYHTLKYLRLQQIVWRIVLKLGIRCKIKNKVQYDTECVMGCFIEELDYDPEFLERFDADEIVNDNITLLNETHKFRWNESWKVLDKSALWNFNLHYFEYLYSLLYEFEQTTERKYLDKAIFCMKSWIQWNPQENGGDGWSPYTISLRLTNWLGFISRANKYIDKKTMHELIQSIYEQYDFLTQHLEKHLLGNHYFENLKTLVLCAISFNDSCVLEEVLELLYEQCDEQILNDGMNFELSPMYHKLIYEDILRVCIWLQMYGKDTTRLESYLRKMADAAHALESGLNRLPLFNDAGTNVAKSLNSLENALKKYFHYEPIACEVLKDAGYYRFDTDKYTLIVDAGKAGPDYIPGHAHCDAMSFELFYDGTPVIVNCGTYAYQCDERNFFRSTSAHNTVMVNDTEQSEYWSIFRLARRSKVRVLQVETKGMTIEMTDYKGHVVKRTICLKDGYLYIKDDSAGNRLTAWYHGILPEQIETKQIAQVTRQPYADAFGKKEDIPVVKVMADDYICVKIRLESLQSAKRFFE